MKTSKKKYQLYKCRKAGLRAEELASKWLKKHGYEVEYTHKGKASNLPYDIICYKGKEGYAIDVKTGKNADISLISFQKLLNKTIKDIRKETKKTKLKPINKVGYIFVLNNNKFIFFEFKINKYLALKAWDTIMRTKK